MLKESQTDGVKAALQHFGIKEASVGGWLKNVGRDVWQGFTGDPAARKALMQGNAFNPGQPLHWKNTLWPTTGSSLSKWMGRLGVILPAYDAYKSLKGESGDPREGRLSNALGSVGNALGFAYGMPLGGMFGGQALSSLGHSVGTHVGRLLGSRPIQPPSQLSDSTPQVPSYYMQPNDSYVPGSH